MSDLRPARFKDLIGQKKLLESLSVSVYSSNIRNEPLGHTLFSGQPGLGKTTLARALANELGVSIQTANGANLRSVKAIVPYLMRIEEKSLFFIDEIHRMTKIVFEFIYPVMEDFKLNMSTEDKDEVVSIDIPKFTLVGATTEAGSLPSPLRDRFKLQYVLEMYNNEELSKLICINCEKLDVVLSPDAVLMLAGASRGTPRIANALLEWVRDYGIAKGLKIVSGSNLEASLAMRGIGLDGSLPADRRYLKFLKKQKSPVGLSTIVSSIGIDIDTVESIVEPFLLAKHLIVKTPKGRAIA